MPSEVTTNTFEVRKDDWSQTRIVEETIIGGKVLQDLLIPDERLNSKGNALSLDREGGTAMDADC